MGSRRHDCRRLVGLWSNVRSVFRSVIEILTRVLFDRCGFEFMLAWVYGTDGDGRDERWWSEAMVQVHHVHVCTFEWLEFVILGKKSDSRSMSRDIHVSTRIG